MSASKFACAACGSSFGADVPTPYQCPQAALDPEADHVLTPTLDTEGSEWPAGDEPNPFIRYRTLLHAWHRLRAGGGSDDAWCELVNGLDERITAIDGAGFTFTPIRVTELAGRSVVKDETVNVAGSHKARHLFGALLNLEVTRLLGDEPDDRRLAIASCGNSALAAAVLARASDRQLDVYITPKAGHVVLNRLRDLGAAVHFQRRGDEPGDPCYHAFQRAVQEGSLPFSVQGPDCSIALDGGRTIAWEFVDQLRAEDLQVDRVFVQVGGGALATAVIRGFNVALALGALPSQPRINAVQARAVSPLVRAWEAIDSASDPAAALRDAARHRTQCMWPWEEIEPSIASAMVDDETYDWHAVIDGMIRSKGEPVAVSEGALRRARDLVTSTLEVDASATATAGVAGAFTMQDHGASFEGETLAFFLTGINR